ncbi:MAG: PIN domain-containing protein [Planctomycetes bacterium]|nr:PIN domain-containing protein [Planctomycetota bacterium]
MNVLVDTTIWSVVLRRSPANLGVSDLAIRSAWQNLVTGGQILLLGIIRQEILSGVADPKVFIKLRNALNAFPDETILTIDHIRAAEMYNLCRAKGVQGSTVDMLICAVAERSSAPIFTTDMDFRAYAKQIPVKILEYR